MICLLMVKACVRSATLFGWADNSRIAQQCSTDFLNSTPLVLNSDFFFLIYIYIYTHTHTHTHTYIYIYIYIYINL